MINFVFSIITRFKMKIQIETTILKSIEKVWKYYTGVEHIVNWNFASDDWHCPKASNDLKVGGKFSSTMAAKDGSMIFDFEGVYDEVIYHKLITYTMPDRRKVKTLFEDNKDSVKVTTKFDAEVTNPTDMQKAGWQTILDNFKIYVESN